MQIGIYAILDKVTNDIVGPLHTHKHHASAIRLFGDIAAQRGSQIAMHPGDYALIQLGTLSDKDEIWHINPRTETILEGSEWAANQTAGQTEQ